MAPSTLQEVAHEAMIQTGSASAAIFLMGPSGRLELAAAAGVTGAPLDALVAAVQSSDHPIARTARDGETVFDVRPIAPGARQQPLTAVQRHSAEEFAARAAGLG